MSDMDECECGHLRDEHLDGRSDCQVDGCRCCLFDEVPDDDEEAPRD